MIDPNNLPEKYKVENFHEEKFLLIPYENISNINYEHVSMSNAIPQVTVTFYVK